MPDPLCPPPILLDRSFWIRHALWPAIAFAVAVVPLELTDLDLLATDPFYDFTARRWTYLEAWWAKGLLHDQGKWSVIACGIACFVALVLSLRSPRWARWRRSWAYAAACLALCPAVAGILKATTGRHCPWEISRYGGRVDWTPLFVAPRVIAEGAPVGKCWPAAHASSAMALCGLYFLALALNWGRARLWLLPSLILGGAFAFAQHARGAHFLSHSIWSAALCWFIALGVFAGMKGRLGPA